MQVPVLVRFWAEDGVWNASAMDIPVAVFGDTFEDARRNFEQALISHFEVLCEMDQMQQTVRILLSKAKERGSVDRIPARQMFEKYLISPEEPCFAHA